MAGSLHTYEEMASRIGTFVDDLELIGVSQVVMNNGAKRWKYHCKCKVCGHEKDIISLNLDKHAGTLHKYCKHNDKTKYDYLVGQTFDDCTVLRVYGKYFHNHGKVQGPYWNATVHCKVCNKIRDIFISELLKSDNHSGKHEKCYIGIYPPRFVHTFDNIKKRCSDVNHKSYLDYGGRGIMCEWTYVNEFADDMLKSYNQKCHEIGEENVSIERIDPNGNYCKENCMWIHKNFRCMNKRNTIYFFAQAPNKDIFYGKCLEYFCRIHNLDKNVMRSALASESHIATNGWYVRRVSRQDYEAYCDQKYDVPADLHHIFACLNNLYHFHKGNPIHYAPASNSIRVTLAQLEAENGMYVPPEALKVIPEIENEYGLIIKYEYRNKTFYITEDSENEPLSVAVTTNSDK